MILTKKQKDAIVKKVMASPAAQRYLRYKIAAATVAILRKKRK